MDKQTLLSEVNLFEELTKEELMDVAAISEMKKVAKGEVILTPEHPAEHLYILKKGQIRLYRTNQQGKQFTLDILKDGNLFGEASTLTLTDYEMYAEAMTDTYVCLMSREEFERFMEKYPKIKLRLVQLLSSKLNDFYKRSEKIALGEVRERILYLLLMLSEKSGRRHQEWQTVEMKLTHQDIATMIGATRETTSAEISRLNKEGYLKKDQVLSIDAEKAKTHLGLVVT
ncbi:Crp/Fnr family transcriptional regulator [Halobacillus sp. HZG1]|uniref:Crp/Fnr family transcriptional regulator n=1 Tax=Halobacillus sp. HZG1 TaxID=3111769 RepID=UPI002DB73488|nr:Crp/Fnr family transcriptional regulator [Halobacillus sp. HZG1]MEC3883617.1 Crp/Fnr family transcriptional regulator [Halobacillus sp. HZG1]